jgi:uncharacterized protein (TIGR03032 family)
MTDRTAPEKPNPSQTAVHYEYSPSFFGLLEQLRASVLISTYQAGKLVVVGVQEKGLDFSFHSFDQAMGVAVRLGEQGPDRIAIGTKRLVWSLLAAPQLGPRIAPAGRYDACFLSRSAHVTGEIHGHEMAWAGRELWLVNTLFSCLCTLHPDYSFVPRWRPPFITALASEDRCHLNGLAMHDGQPKYVTAMAETDTPGGWRPTKASSGCLIDVPNNAIVARGFAMPHSPRVHEGRVWVLDSGRGQMVLVDPNTGRAEPAAQLPGYTRGLAFYGPFAFVGLSRIRETAVFGGVPIAEQGEPLQCGVQVLDLRTGRTVAGLEFHSGVEEIFDVQILPGVRFPAVTGPVPAADGGETIWLVAGPHDPALSQGQG